MRTAAIAAALCTSAASAQIVFTDSQFGFNSSFDSFQGVSGYDDGGGFGVSNASPSDIPGDEIDPNATFGGGTSGGVIDEGNLTAYSYAKMELDFDNTTVTSGSAVMNGGSAPSSLTAVATGEIFFDSTFDATIDDPVFGFWAGDINNVGYSTAVFWDYFFTVEGGEPVEYTLNVTTTVNGIAVPAGVIDLEFALNGPDGRVQEGMGLLTPGEYRLSDIDFGIRFNASQIGLEQILAGGNDFLASVEVRFELVLPTPGAAATLGVVGIAATRRRR